METEWVLEANWLLVVDWLPEADWVMETEQDWAMGVDWVTERYPEATLQKENGIVSIMADITEGIILITDTADIMAGTTVVITVLLC